MSLPADVLRYVITSIMSLALPIDLGPEGCDGGGEIVAWAPPEDIVKAPRSYTGKFLEPVLKKANAPRKKRSGGATEAAE
jgi:excinuclease ABC subunit A